MPILARLKFLWYYFISTKPHWYVTEIWSLNSSSEGGTGMDLNVTVTVFAHGPEDFEIT